MIGCLILGTFAAMGAARLIRHRYGCGGPGWGHGHGGCAPAWRGMHGFHHHFHRPGAEGDPYGFGGHGYNGPDGSDPFGPGFGPDVPPRGRGFVDSMVAHVLGRIRVTATQERDIRAALDEFRDEIKEVGQGERQKTRADIGAALRRPHFDEVFMGELFARQDTALERGRKAFVGLMAKVHEALDEEQRGRLADLVEKGPRLWRRGRGW